MALQVLLARKSPQHIDYFAQMLSSGANAPEHGLQLHSSKTISIYFEPECHLGLNVSARLRFSPFSNPHCSFVYHSYNIHASVVESTEVETSALTREAIARSTQRLYNLTSFEGGRVNFVTIDQLDWPRIVPSAGTESHSSHGFCQGLQQDTSITIEQVRRSHKLLHQEGLLTSLVLPELLPPNADNDTPYCIPDRSDSLKTAFLDLPKAENIRQDLAKVLQKAPAPPSQWGTTRRLTPADVRTIIGLAQGMEITTIRKPSCLAPTISSLIQEYRTRGSLLSKNKVLYGHAKRLVNAIECSLMVIQEHLDGGDRTASTKVGAGFFSTLWANGLTYADQYCDGTRKAWRPRPAKEGSKVDPVLPPSLSCYRLALSRVGIVYLALQYDDPLPASFLVSHHSLLPESDALRLRFSITNPAFFGEIVEALKSKEYTTDLGKDDGWKDIPTLVELLVSVTNGVVGRCDVYRALRYPLPVNAMRNDQQQHWDVRNAIDCNGCLEPSPILSPLVGMAHPAPAPPAPDLFEMAPIQFLDEFDLLESLGPQASISQADPPSAPEIQEVGSGNQMEHDLLMLLNQSDCTHGIDSDL